MAEATGQKPKEKRMSKRRRYICSRRKSRNTRGCGSRDRPAHLRQKGIQSLKCSVFIARQRQNGVPTTRKRHPTKRLFGFGTMLLMLLQGQMGYAAGSGTDAEGVATGNVVVDKVFSSADRGVGNSGTLQPHEGMDGQSMHDANGVIAVGPVSKPMVRLRRMRKKPTQAQRDGRNQRRKAKRTAGTNKTAKPTTTSIKRRHDEILSPVELNAKQTARKARKAEYARASRKKRTDGKRIADKASNRVSMEASRLERTEERRASDKASDKASKGASRLERTEERRASDKASDKASKGASRLERTEGQRIAVNAVNQVATAATRAARTQEQHTAVNAANRVATAATRAARAQEQNTAVNAANRVATAATRAARTQEQNTALNALRARASVTARAARTPGERTVLNAKAATAKRDRRSAMLAVRASDTVNFSTIELTERSNFDDCENNPECTAVKFHLNSGHGRFRGVDDPLQWPGLIEEIRDEALSPVEADTLVSDFYTAQGRAGYNGVTISSNLPSYDAPIITCSCCGIRDSDIHGQNSFHPVALDRLSEESLLKLELSSELVAAYENEKTTTPIMIPTDAVGGSASIAIHKLRSVYCSTRLNGRTGGDTETRYLHLHPEFVDNKQDGEHTFFCSDCHTSVVKDRAVPSNSIAAGVQLGDYRRLGLTAPNAFEVALISKVRHYHNIVKIQPNGGGVGCRSNNTHCKMRAHSILFPHDAPEQACLALLLSNNRTADGGYDAESIRKTISEKLTVQFIAPEGEIDELIRQTLQTHLVRGRAFVVYQWLLVLQQVNPLYANDPRLPPLHILDEVVTAANEAIMKDAERITDQDSLNLEQVMGDDVAAVRTTAVPQDDVGVCNGNVNAEGVTGATAPNIVPVSYSVVCEKSPSESRDRGIKDTAALETVHFLVQAAEAFAVDATGAAKKWYSSARKDLPLNEFDNAALCLCGAFPHIFMYGTGYDNQADGIKYPPAPKRHRHILLQYTTVPATCRELIFYLFDQKQRHATMRNMAAKVKSSPAAFVEYGKLIGSRRFAKKLQVAIRKPKGKEAREVVAEILPILAVGGGRTPFGAFEQNSSVMRTMALSMRYGPACTFLTISPDDISNPTSYRLTFRGQSNTVFPAVITEEFIGAMEQDAPYLGSGTVAIPTDYSSKVKASCTNPVAAVLEYNKLIQNVLTTLVGLKPGDRTKRSWYYADPLSECHRKGVFGRILAMHGVHETQQRGSLHCHIVLWGGISATLLEGAAEYQELCDVISGVLDSMYSAALPADVHMKDLLGKEMRRHSAPKIDKRGPAAVVVPGCINDNHPVHDQRSWKSCAQHTCLAGNIHNHSFTCHKPPSGGCGCRMARPCGLRHATLPTFLYKHDDPLVHPDDATVQFSYKSGKDTVTSCCTTDVIPSRIDTSTRNIRQQPIPKPDDRILVWELRRPELDALPDVPLHGTVDTPVGLAVQCIANLVRVLSSDGNNDPEVVAQFAHWMEQVLKPEQAVSMYRRFQQDFSSRNGLVVEHNDILLNITGSRVNASLLGNTSQSKSALFYIAPYIGKSKVDFGTCLVTLNAAAKHVQKYKSTTGDTGSTRVAQHTMTRVINQLNKNMEVSDTQAVLGLLDVGSNITSDNFSFYGASDAVHFISSQIHEAHLETLGVTSLSSGGSSSDERSGDESTSVVSDAGNDTDVAGVSSGVPAGDIRLHDTDSFISEQDDYQHLFGSPDAEGDSTDFLPDVFGTHGVDPSSLKTYKIKAKLYRVDDDAAQWIPVCYQTHYRYRGKQLRNLCRHEYYSFVSIKKLPKSVTAGCVKRGRRSTTLLYFDKGHPLHATHAQYLCSKLSTPIFLGKKPSHPGPPPSTVTASSGTIDVVAVAAMKEWNAEANAFAFYYLAAFRPEPTLYSDVHTVHPLYTWDALCDWVSFLESNTSLIAFLRLQALRTAVYGTYCRNGDRLMMSAYRMRNRTIWDDESRAGAKDFFGRSDVRLRNIHQDDALAKLFDDGDLQEIGKREMTQYKKDLQYSHAQRRSIQFLFSQSQHNGCPLDASATIMPPLLTTTMTEVARVNNGVIDVRADALFLEVDRIASQASTRAVLRGGTVDCEATVTAELAEFDIPQEQMDVIQRVRLYLRQLGPHTRRSHQPPTPLELLVTGMPGTGKSFVIERICDIACWYKSGSVAATAFNGIAAVNIDGVTLCKLLGIQVGERGTTKTHVPQLSSEKLAEIRLTLQSATICLLIVDEVSNLDAFCIANIDIRLRQIMGNDNVVFGGLGVLFFGDFGQLPPVKADSLALTLMQLASLDAAGPSLPTLPPPTAVTVPTTIHVTIPENVTVPAPAPVLLPPHPPPVGVPRVFYRVSPAELASATARLRGRRQCSSSALPQGGGVSPPTGASAGSPPPVAVVTVHDDSMPFASTSRQVTAAAAVLPSPSTAGGSRVFSRVSPAQRQSAMARLRRERQCSSPTLTENVGPTPLFGAGVRSPLPPVVVTVHDQDSVQPQVSVPVRRFQRVSVHERDCNLKETRRKAKAAQRTQTRLNSYGRYSAQSLARRGGTVFRGCERYHLQEQKRSTDTAHTAFLTKLSRGETITRPDLRRYKALSPDDLSGAGSRWKFAPVLVALNRERVDIVHHKTVLFAQDKHTCIIRWRTTLGQWKGRPVLPAVSAALEDADPCFWQYFVPGVDAYLTYNMNPVLGLANGTPIQLHSLTLSQEQLLHVESLMATLPPGGTITLDSPPVAVNIKIGGFGAPNNKLSLRKTAQLQLLRQHSIVDGEVVIPLLKGNVRKFQSYTVDSPGGIGRVQTRDIFAYESSFAMTIHKAQGRTIPCVVLALSDRHNHTFQMEYAAIYVAMSRVRESGDLRILFHDSDAAARNLSLRYISNLRHSVHVLNYYDGFRAPGLGVWDASLSLLAAAQRVP